MKEIEIILMPQDWEAKDGNTFINMRSAVIREELTGDEMDKVYDKLSEVIKVMVE